MLAVKVASNPSLLMRIPSLLGVAVSPHTLEVLICGGSLTGSIFAGGEERLPPHRGNRRRVRGSSGREALKLEKVVLLIFTRLLLMLWLSRLLRLLLRRLLRARRRRWDNLCLRVGDLLSCTLDFLLRGGGGILRVRYNEIYGYWYLVLGDLCDIGIELVGSNYLVFFLVTLSAVAVGGGLLAEGGSE